MKENSRISNISQLIDQGDFDNAFEEAIDFFGDIEVKTEEDAEYFFTLYQLACLFIDIGQLGKNKEASIMGIELFHSYDEVFYQLIDESNYHYNWANAKQNLVPEENPFENTFENIEPLLTVKNDYWRAIKFAKADAEEVLRYKVNLANALKRQFRITEALKLYSDVINLNLDIPQAWINRSEALIMTNNISGSHSIKMLYEIKTGYDKTSISPSIPADWVPHYKERASFFLSEIDSICAKNEIDKSEYDEHETQAEFDELSDYWKFCLNKSLVLSEHSLYCPCVGSSRDNLSIMTVAGSVSGVFIPAMERVLNRLKSEYSLARHFYYEYHHHRVPSEQTDQICFSELLNNELLGLDIEKIRTSFRLCFGVLDKIAVAICDLHELHPPGGNVYFHNFWRLDTGDRRQKFEAIKTPGLLALYSIATDLNERKNGEWGFYREWRNALEHDSMIVYEGELPDDPYQTYSFSRDPLVVSEESFVDNLYQLLQLTRSAIFSYVFVIRDKGKTEVDDGPRGKSVIIGKKGQQA